MVGGATHRLALPRRGDRSRGHSTSSESDSHRRAQAGLGGSALPRMVERLLSTSHPLRHDHGRTGDHASAARADRGLHLGIADDVLRDLYVRGKYRDVILPMTVLRRFDAVLEPTKQAVLEMKRFLDEQKIVDQDSPAARRRRPRGLQHVEVHAPRPPLARRANNSCASTSRRTSKGSRRRFRRSWRRSSFATRSRGSRKRTRSER